MITYKYPTNVALDMVTQEYIAQTAKFLGEQLMPFEDTNTQVVQWDELDSERGMTAPHTMGTDPKIDTRPGSTLREFEPIPFKETDLVKENELLKARAYGTLGGVVNITDAISRIAKSRVDKNRIRVEWTRWQALLGQLTILENGVRVNESFAVQTHDVAVPFSTVATAAPLKEFNAVMLKFRATGASAQGAEAYMNQATANNLLENQNENDLKGFQNANFVHLPYSMEEMNKIQTARGLPKLVVYDEGYIDEAGSFQNFIPNGKIIVVGKRPAGQAIGKWLMTPTLHRVKNGMPAPGMFEIIEVNGMPSTGSVTVNLQQLGQHKNPKIEVTGGVYGGPVLYYPRSIVVMDVS